MTPRVAFPLGFALAAAMALVVAAATLTAHAGAPDVEPAIVGMPRGADGFPLPLDGDRWSRADAAWALGSLATARVRCTAHYETGMSGSNDPYSVGGAGERGILQIHPQGLEPDFRRRGYTDIWSPWQQVSYTNEAFERGMAGNWSPILRGLC